VVGVVVFGFGVVVWPQNPKPPNPQSPIPNPQYLNNFLKIALSFI